MPYLLTLAIYLNSKREANYTFGAIMKKTSLLVIALFSVFNLFAQVEVVEVVEVSDSLLGSKAEDTALVLTNVNVFKDPRLAALKKRPALVAKKNAYTSKLERKERILAYKKKKLGVSTLRNEAPVKRGKKTVTGSIVNRKGYRIVIYSGSNRAQALNTKRSFMRRYPSTRSYMSYNAPYFKIRVGNFASKKSAYRFMRKIQGSFPKVFVVPDIVTIKNINVR